MEHFGDSGRLPSEQVFWRFGPIGPPDFGDFEKSDRNFAQRAVRAPRSCAHQAHVSAQSFGPIAFQRPKPGRMLNVTFLFILLCLWACSCAPLSTDIRWNVVGAPPPCRRCVLDILEVGGGLGALGHFGIRGGLEAQHFRHHFGILEIPGLRQVILDIGVH